MRVLVTPHKFKGTLSAAEVADAIAEGLGAAAVSSSPPTSPTRSSDPTALLRSSGLKRAPIPTKWLPSTPVSTI
jgi:hypothetical protein